MHRRNLDSTLPTARLLDEMGVDEMRIIRTTEVPRWNENAQGATLEFAEYFDAMPEFARVFSSESHSMIVDIWQFLTPHPYAKAYRIRPVECGCGEYRDSIPVCRGNRVMVAVSANGNVKEHGLQPLLQCGRYLAEVCTTVGELASVNETCGSCPYFRHCLGGCRAIALTLTGDKMGVDLSKCLFFQKEYVQKVQECRKAGKTSHRFNSAET